MTESITITINDNQIEANNYETIWEVASRNGIEIPNRRNAIKLAIKDLRNNETLMIAGKGHETTQDYGNKVISISDKKIIVDMKRQNVYGPGINFNLGPDSGKTGTQI